jgi:hypothetical protein
MRYLQFGWPAQLPSDARDARDARYITKLD